MDSKLSLLRDYVAENHYTDHNYQLFQVDSKLSSLREVESRLRERLLDLEQSEQRLQQRSDFFYMIINDYEVKR